MEAKQIMRALGCKNGVELFLGDPWYDQSDFYSTAYFENFLKLIAPFASKESVCVYLGRSTVIRSLIANYTQSARGKKDIRDTGWGWVDNESFDFVNSSLNTTRAGGMISNRDSAIVVYMKGWKTKPHKKIFTDNARDPEFWKTFPEIWRPPEAHQSNVLTNTLTGYRSVRKYLKNEETNQRVRSKSEKNPMLYIYLMQKYTKGPGSLVMDCFAGTMASVLAAMHTDNKVIVFEKDKKCAKIAIDRIYREAMKLTHKAGAQLGEIKPAMLERRARTKTKAESELLEWSYSKMISHSDLWLTDPRFPPPAVYDVAAAAALYGVEIKQVQTHEIGEGLFALKGFEADSCVVPVLGRWVRRQHMNMKVNRNKEYIVFAGEDRRPWAFEMEPEQLAIKINDYRGVAEAPNCCIAVEQLTLKEYHAARATKKATFLEEQEKEGVQGADLETLASEYIDSEDQGFIYICMLGDSKVADGDQFFMDYGNVYWRGRRDLGGQKKKKIVKKKKAGSASDDDSAGEAEDEEEGEVEGEGSPEEEEEEEEEE